MITINTSSGAIQEVETCRKAIVAKLESFTGERNIEINVSGDLSFKVKCPSNVTREFRDLIEDRLEGSMKDYFNLSPRVLPRRRCDMISSRDKSFAGN